MTCKWCGDVIQIRPDGRTWESADRLTPACGQGTRHAPSEPPVVQSPSTRSALSGTLPGKLLRI